MPNRRLKSKALLAAPIVVTAMFAPACGGPIHTNPGPPEQEPRPPEEVTPSNPGPPRDVDSPDTTPGPTPSTPTGAPDTAPTTAVAPTSTPPANLPDPPDGNGLIQRRADGTCLYYYPHPDMKCPPTARCNPGPPRDPIAVKCPPDVPAHAK